MQTYKFRGYLKEVADATQWAKKFVLCEVADESKVKWPQYIEFELDPKKRPQEIALLDGCGPNSLVEVEFAPFLKRGTAKGTGRAYSISRNVAMHLEAIARVEPQFAAPEPQEEEAAGGGLAVLTDG